MICEKVRELIPLYHYGELGDDEIREVRGHLSDCERCRDELERIEKILNAIQVHDVPELADEVWSRNVQEIMAGVRRGSVKAVRTGSRVRRWVMPVWISAAAAVVLFVLALQTGVHVEREPDKRNVLDQETQTAEEIELLEAEIGTFWNGQTAEGFDSEFTEDLDVIENSIDSLLIEVELGSEVLTNGSV